MKINCIGTGTMGSITRGNQSILIEDTLIDIGSGIVKKLESLQIYSKNVKRILITHVHADHLVDLPNFLIGRNIRNENKECLKIICGKGVRETIINLFELCFGDGQKNKYKDFEKKFNVEFIELKNNQVYKDEDLEITAYELEHGGCKPILGFTIEKNKKIIGYATDTTLCTNVKTICQKSDIAFLDATNTVPTKSHMGLNELLELKAEFRNCRICAIHRSDYVHNHIEGIEFPEDGEIIEI